MGVARHATRPEGLRAADRVSDLLPPPDTPSCAVVVLSQGKGPFGNARIIHVREGKQTSTSNGLKKKKRNSISKAPTAPSLAVCGRNTRELAKGLACPYQPRPQAFLRSSIIYLSDPRGEREEKRSKASEPDQPTGRVERERGSTKKRDAAPIECRRVCRLAATDVMWGGKRDRPLTDCIALKHHASVRRDGGSISSSSSPCPAGGLLHQAGRLFFLSQGLESTGLTFHFCVLLISAYSWKGE
jgi:hypothetical protein